MPRSGTSWLSQIVESSPACAVRLSPNFSFPLKHQLHQDSGAQDWQRTLDSALSTDDPFMTQNYRRDTGELGRFADRPEAPVQVLAIKDTRFHDLYLAGMERLANAKLVYIVRHPAACLWSWRSCKEFPADASFDAQWRSGACRKTGSTLDRAGEYWGFDDWKRLTRTYSERAASQPDRYYILHYERLVMNSEAEAAGLFAFLGLPFAEASRAFVRDSQSRHDPRPYAVFKDKSVAQAWRSEFPDELLRQIEAETRESPLAAFVER